MIRRIVAAALVSLALLLGVLAATPAGAEDPPSFVVIDSTSIVPANGTFRLVLDPVGIPPQTRITVTVLPAVVSDNDLVQALRGTLRTRPLATVVDRPIAELLNLAKHIELFVATRTDPDPESDPDAVDTNAVALDEPGVYPVRISSGGNNPVQLTTFIVRSDSSPAQPLTLSGVVVVDDSPTIDVNGTVTIRVRQQLDELMAARTSLPVSLAVRPELVDGLATGQQADDSARLDELARLGAQGELVADTYVRLDPSLAAVEGLHADYADHLRLGEQRLAARFPQARVSRLIRALPTPQTDAGYELVRATGAQSVVGIELTTSPNSGSLVATSTSGPVVLRSDPLVLEALDGPYSHDAITRRVIAALAFRALREPGAGVAMVWSGQFDTIAIVERAALELGPAGAGLLVTQPASTLVESVRPTADPTPIETVATPQGTGIAAQLAAVRAELAVWESQVETPIVVPPTLLAAATSTDLTDDERRQYIDRLAALSEPLRAIVEPVTSGRLTLGSADSLVPITLRATTREQVNVVLRITGTRLREPFVQKVTIRNGVWQSSVPLEIREGRSILNIELLTPVGERVVSSGSIDVQVFGLGGAAAVLTIGPLVLLALWWYLYTRRHRRLGHQSRHPSNRVRHHQYPDLTGPDLASH